MHPLDLIEGPNRCLITHQGPSLDLGALPAFFYFALSAEESLALEPYNQPATFLAEKSIRVFSLTLPFHGSGFNMHHAMSDWAQAIIQGHNFVKEFVLQCMEALDFLVEQGYVNQRHVAVGGLSRGGFMATHFAAADKRVSHLLGFAPLTKLQSLKEFSHLPDHPLAQQLSLLNLAENLGSKKVRFYIGNRDHRVSTAACFELIQALTEAAHQQRHRALPIELIIYSSIGHQGHGTPPEVFKSGAEWLQRHLE